MLFVVGSFCPVIRQCCCFRTPVIIKYVPVPTSPTKFVSKMQSFVVKYMRARVLQNVLHPSKTCHKMLLPISWIVEAKNVFDVFPEPFTFYKLINR